MQEFYKQDFQFLYNDCFSEHDRGDNGVARLLQITEKGVFYDVRLLEGLEALELLRWKPVHELSGPNKPPSSGPALPFPFTASQLAAFMLYGWGHYFEAAFGKLDVGPKEFVLNGDHEDGADAYESLRQAYVIYQDALCVVGKLDHEEQQRAHDLLQQLGDAYDQAMDREKVMERVVIGKKKDESPVYGDFIPRDIYLLRLARAKEAVAAQKFQALQAKAEADAALKTWRRAMVRRLLQPEESCSQAQQSSDAQPQTTTASESLKVTEGAKARVPMLKQPAQEIRILELLKSKGHDPLNLPAREPGKRGVKSEIKQLALLEPGLFSKKTFDTAWQRVRGDGLVAGGE